MHENATPRNKAAQGAPVDQIGATLSRIRYHRKPQEAERLNISPRLLDKWIAGKVIPYRKVGRAVLLDPAEVDRCLADKWRVAAVGESRIRKHPAPVSVTGAS